MSKLYGVLVGVDYYPNDKNELAKTLCCAVNDVERAFEILSLSREDTDLILLANRDASVERIRKEVETIGKKIKAHDDTFLFMFSGHGWATRVKGEEKEEGEATAVFLTGNFDGEILPGRIPTGGFTLENLAGWLGRKKQPKNIIVVLDSCCSGQAVGGGSHIQNRQFCEDSKVIIRTLDHKLEKGLDIITVKPAGSPDIWPKASNLVVFAAAEGQSCAFEDVTFGHGLFTGYLLEWWEKEFSQNGVDDFGGKVLDYVKKKLQTTKNKQGSPWSKHQIPATTTRSTVSFGKQEHWRKEVPISDPLISQGFFPPDPSPELEGNHEIEQKLRDALMSETTVLKKSNIVFHGPLFSNKTSLVAKIVLQLLTEGKLRHDQVFYIGAEYEEVALPAIFAYVNRSRYRSDIFRLSLEPPILDRSYDGMITNLVKHLSDIKARVILSYRSHTIKNESQKFLELCSKDERIRLCLIVNSGQDIPYNIPSTEATFIKNKRKFIPPRFLGNDQSITSCDDFIDPSIAYRSVLEKLFEKLNDETTSKNKEAFDLLRAFSLTRLPRNHTFALNLAQNLNLCQNASKFDRMIKFLIEHGLVCVRKSKDFNEEIYFVHALIKNTLRNYIKRETQDLAILHESIAKSYEHLLLKKYTPGLSSIWIHEMIRHWIEANRWEEASKRLIQHWNTLIDSGYQRIVINWVEILKAELYYVDRVDLLLKEQSLRRHRQEWDKSSDIFNRIRDIYCEIESDESLSEEDKQRVVKGYWKSRYHFATNFMIRRSYPAALKEYEACIEWLYKQKKTDVWESSLACECFVRTAHCYVLSSDMTRASRALELAQILIDTIPGETALVKFAHKGTVEIEKARLTEDYESLYHLALKNWSESLKAGKEQYYQHVFSLAIARVHMAWACLTRGECLRAWRHCIRARQMMNTRGVPELWWISEIERIASLSIAWTFLSPERRFLRLWPEEARVETSSHQRFFRGQLEGDSPLELQCKYMKDILEICRKNDTWRAAEVMSAYGQLLSFPNERESTRGDGLELLRHAIDLAQESGHRKLTGYILEAMVALTENASSAFRMSEESCYIAASCDLSRPLLRRCISSLSLQIKMCRDANDPAKKLDHWDKAWSWLAASLSLKAKVGFIWQVVTLDMLLKDLKELAAKSGYTLRTTSPIPDSKRLVIDPFKLKNRRAVRGFRYACSIPCYLTFDNKQIRGKAVNISLRGISILIDDKNARVINEPKKFKAMCEVENCYLTLGSRMDEISEKESFPLEKMRLFELDKKWVEHQIYISYGFQWGIACYLKNELPIIAEAIKCDIEDFKDWQK